MTQAVSISAFEATSFMNKFKDLWHAGHQASLSFETEAGQAWATLRVALGPHPVPQRKHVKPSQLRRRERREAARNAEEAVQANTVTPSKIAEEAPEEETTFIQTYANVLATKVKEKSDENPRNAEQAHTCLFCDKTFSTENGLKTHEGKIHKPCTSPIPQVDGCEEIEFIEFTFKSDYAEEDVKDSLNKVQEKIKLEAETVSTVKLASPLISATKEYVIRLGPVIANDFLWPKLEADDEVVFSDLRRI